MFLFLLYLTAITLLGFFLGYTRSRARARQERLLSLPRHYGLYVALWAGAPSLGALILLLLLLGPSATKIAVATLPMALVGLFVGYKRLFRNKRVSRVLDRWINGTMLACSSLTVVAVVGITVTLLLESLVFFHQVSPLSFFFGTHWSPQTSALSGTEGGSFGALPLFAGTFLITGVAMAVAIPLGLFSALYLSEYATRPWRALLRPTLEILAGIPTVVYGFFAVLYVSPALHTLGQHIGLSISSESALGAGLVMGVMIIPFISSLSEHVLSSIPKALKESSKALGATPSETLKKVVIPAALPGIIASFFLAVSRALGETMIVVMAVGYDAHLTANPLHSVTTVTVQIVNFLVGDQSVDSPATSSVFALGLTLFIMTFFLNLISTSIVRFHARKR